MVAVFEGDDVTHDLAADGAALLDPRELAERLGFSRRTMSCPADLAQGCPTFASRATTRDGRSERVPSWSGFPRRWDGTMSR